MPAVGLPVLKVGIRFASGADNDGWLLGSSALPTQLGEPDDASVYQDWEPDGRHYCCTAPDSTSAPVDRLA